MKKDIQCDQPHPGEILREFYLEPLHLSIRAASTLTHISYSSLSKIINGMKSVSDEIALKLSVAFDTTPQFWINCQNNYDLSWERDKGSKQTSTT